MKQSFRWRALAIISLLTLLTLAGFAAVLLFRNFWLALAMFGTALICLYAGWLVLSGSGTRYRLGRALLVVGLLVLTGEAIAFLTKDNNLRVLVAALALAGSYLVIVSILRTRYWQQKRARGQVAGGMQFRHPVLIVNPKSGDGRAIRADIPAKARQQGIEVAVLQPGDDMAAIARRAVADGADVLGVSGGDGSLGVIAAVAIESDVPMVVLPGGTRCHFARDLGMDPKRIEDALASFRGVVRRVDVGDINGRIFLNNVSLGVYADIVDRPDYREHKMTASQTVLREIMGGHRQSYDLRFVGPKSKSYKRAVLLLVGVNSYQTLNLLELGYRDQLDGGVLQMTAVTALDDALIRRLLNPLIFGRGRAGVRNVMQWTAKEFAVSSGSSELVAGVDGEREQYKTPIIITVRPKALRVLVPAEGVRPRQRRAFDAAVIRKIEESVTAQARRRP